MKQRFCFLIKYFLYWLVFFTFARLLFLAYEFNQSSQVTINDLWGLLIRGVWMDTSLAGYILLFSGIFLTLLFYSNGKWIKIVFKYFTLIILTIFSLIVVSDAELYRNWGFRIDATPILYLKTPGEALASVTPFLIILLSILTIIIIVTFFLFYQKWVLKKSTSFEKGKWWYIPIFLFFSATMIIPIRGNFGIAPMNPGKVYFSQNMYSNHAALNSIWNMMYSMSMSNSMYKRYPDHIDKAKATEIVSKLMLDNGSIHKVLKTDRPNVVILLLESFSGKMIEPIGGLPNITPNINKLCKQGILFSKMYASGDRSDKGIIAVVSGFPAQSTQSIIKYPFKSKKLPTISQILDSAGYKTTFYYGGNPDFANIRSFLYSSKFRRIITQDDFPKSYRNSKWGVHDEFVFKRLMNDCDSAKVPFFKMYFTLSSHEPFEIPRKPKFKGNDEQTKFLSSVNYADSCIGAFIDEARTKEWYKNTIFVLIADHGHRYPGNDPVFVVNHYKIPMVWIGGALNVDSMVVKTTGSQIDLATTLLSQLGLKTNQFKFSKNLLSDDCKPYAYYAFNNGFGFVTDSTALIFDHTSQKFISREGKDIEKVTDEAFSFFSHYQDIFLNL